MLSALVILAYVPPEARAPTFRDALPAALLCGIALLLSFDRFALALLGVALAAGAEWLARTVRRESPRVALLRALRFAALLGVVLAVIGLGAVLAGADLLEYVVGQRQLAAGYASGMRTPWYVGVPPPTCWRSSSPAPRPRALRWRCASRLTWPRGSPARRRRPSSGWSRPIRATSSWPSSRSSPCSSSWRRARGSPPACAPARRCWRRSRCWAGSAPTRTR
ncbi:MAG: hypothetical protein M5U28_47830 [Sandaracinaceae bacterium]|nr:hypothetical protein [Sandaracinaceae bacterium]